MKVGQNYNESFTEMMIRQKFVFKMSKNQMSKIIGRVREEIKKVVYEGKQPEYV